MPVRHRVMQYVCSNKSKNCSIIYNGEEDCIFFWSKDTACAVEVGYDFQSILLEFRGNFSKFCSYMNREYKKYNPDASTFLSVGTFEKWFFSWSAALEIDFRKSTDPFCGNNPTTVACDGTHVGVSFKQLDILPIDKPDNDIVVSSLHRKFDRTFMPYNNKPNKADIKVARQDLLQACLYFVEMEGERLGDEAIVNILQCIPQDPQCSNFIIHFINDDFSIDLRTAAARFLGLLLKDAPVSSVLPFSKLDRLTEVIAALKEQTQNILSKEVLDFLSTIGPEIELLLRQANQFLPSVCDFISYLCSFIISIHQNDPPTQPAIPIDGSYDPESGICYYFADGGKKVRQLPMYSITDYKDTCRKNYTKVGKHGWGYLFIWSCAEHGHVYGFHLISGAEGRKDPFSSAYQYMESAPEHIYYDFGCAFSDYCLNREPSFFRNTQFWIDEFHGHNHVCGDNHKPARVEGIPHPNTSICEQFNSYISDFKYFCNRQTQSHFCFFLQSFIHIWNQRKTEINLSRHAAELKAVE